MSIALGVSRVPRSSMAAARGGSAAVSVAETKRPGKPIVLTQKVLQSFRDKKDVFVTPKSDGVRKLVCVSKRDPIRVEVLAEDAAVDDKRADFDIFWAEEHPLTKRRPEAPIAPLPVIELHEFYNRPVTDSSVLERGVVYRRLTSAPGLANFVLKPIVKLSGLRGLLGESLVAAAQGVFTLWTAEGDLQYDGLVVFAEGTNVYKWKPRSLQTVDLVYKAGGQLCAAAGAGLVAVGEDRTPGRTGQVWECEVVGDTLHPKKPRTDKTKPNAILTVISTLLAVAGGVSLNDLLRLE